MDDKFDLIVVGAGCVGIATAYYALKQGLKVCLIQKGKIGSDDRYWSSNFSARQNRVQYNDEYLTRFVLESNKEWNLLEKELACPGQNFLYREGAQWFGNKNTNSSQGNIKASNAVITLINSTVKDKKNKIESLYMERIMQESPEFMKAFKPPTGQQDQWDSWSALYQPDGGSVNMQASYNAFHRFIKQKITILDGVTIQKFQKTKNEHQNEFTFSGGKCGTVSGKKVLISVGPYTPHFLKDIMNYPHLVDHNINNSEYQIQQYVASYIQIEDKYDTFYEKMPNFINFLPVDQEKQQYTGYGFPYHSWDTLKTGKFIKIGTMANKGFKNTDEQKYFLSHASNKEIPQTDPRARAAISYVDKRMNHLIPKSKNNRHFPCPIIFFSGRQTLVDYLQRKDESIVVQSGGWIGKYYPLLGKTITRMLFRAEQIQTQRGNDSVVGNFLNRTRFPLKPYVRDQLKKNNFKYPSTGQFKTIVIGAGSAGLYSAYRINQAKEENVGVFQLSSRISGRLKSFYFHGTKTPMELGGMRYIPKSHTLVAQMVAELGIPSIPFLMDGDPIQNYMRRSYLRNDTYQMSEWESNQKAKHLLVTSYRLEGPIIGMNAFQIISFSFYQIITAPQNLPLLIEIFLQKSDEEIRAEKIRRKKYKQFISSDEFYFRTWTNYVYQDPQNKCNYMVDLTLQQWNRLKPVLVFRFPFGVDSKDVYIPQSAVANDYLHPLYKFGFQNVIQVQFGHEAYQFVAQQNGYFSNTSNAAYLDQVMTYLIDFGDVKYRTLVGGYDNINYAMANKLVDEQNGLPARNGGIFLNHKLVNIEKTESGKYLLTFHINQESQAHSKSLQTKDQPFKNHLRSGLKRSQLEPNKKHQLGSHYQIPGKKGIKIIQFTTEKLILAIPRRSIQILYDQIQILQQPLTTYEQIYAGDRKDYEQIFRYQSYYKYLNEVPNVKVLTQCELNVRKDLLKKEDQKINNPNNPKYPGISVNELLYLGELNQRYFLHQYIQKIKLAEQNQQWSMEQIFTNDQPIEPQNLRVLTNSTQLMPAMKIVMNFTKNWWDPNVRINQEYNQTYKNTNMVSSVEEMRGVSVTDLPIRQTLYFASGEDNLLLASFNDMITTEFWTALHNNFSQVWKQVQKKATEKKEQKETEKKSCCNKKKCIIAQEETQYPPSEHIHLAKTVIVKQVLRQLSLIHNIDVQEEWVKECLYQFWGNDPFGAGYHNFYAGYYIPSVMRCMRKPWKGESMYIVGEAYSNDTEWVEGCFQTADRLLTEEFGLKQFVKGYYPGY